MAAKGYDTVDTQLMCYNGAGFGPGLRAEADRASATLVDLKAIYG